MRQASKRIPESADIRHWALEVEIKKAHERQAVADQVLDLLIREIVERREPRPTSRRNRSEVRFHCEAPGIWPANWMCEATRCLAGWLLCLAYTTAQSAQPQR